MKPGRIPQGILHATLLLLIILSITAAVASTRQARPCFAMPTSYIFIINEAMALLAALAFLMVAYGISRILKKKQ